MGNENLKSWAESCCNNLFITYLVKTLCHLTLDWSWVTLLWKVIISLIQYVAQKLFKLYQVHYMDKTTTQFSLS